MKTQKHIIKEHIESAPEARTNQIYDGLLDEEEILFIDEDISLGVKPDSIRAAMIAERATERIVRSNAVICKTSPKNDALFVSDPEFVFVRNAIYQAVHADLGEKYFSPLPDLFLRHALKNFPPANYLDTNPNELMPWGIKFGQAVNDLASAIRVDYKSEAFANKMKNHEDNYLHRHRRNKKLIARLLENHSKLCVVRLDLHLGKANNEHLNLASARKHISRFTNNQRHNQLFADKVAHVIKLELSHRRGYHFHVFIFFDGQAKRNADYYANEIGHYWINTITKGNGSFYSCHQHKNRYKRCGIGLVDWDDQEKISALLYAMSYVAKSDQHFREKDSRKQRAWFTSPIPPRRQTHGRPRKTTPTSAAEAVQPSQTPLGG